MANVAFNSSELIEVIKPNHVTYDIYDYQYIESICHERDPETNACLDWEDVYGWVYTGKGYRDALLKGHVQSDSNVYANGQPIARVSDTTLETWAVTSPIPNNTSSREYRNITPASSGAGVGHVIVGNSSSVFVNGRSVAVIGSEVDTHIDYPTKIGDGSPNVTIG